MDDDFDLSISYKGEELVFPARFLRLGYSYQIEVYINGVAIYFERDEQREWRMITSLEEMNTNSKWDIDLIRTIAATIDNILK